DAGSARGGGDAAAEHVGEPAAASLVQQDEHDRQQAQDGQQDLEDELEKREIHGEGHLPPRRTDRSSIRHGPGPIRTRPAWDVLRSLRDDVVDQTVLTRLISYRSYLAVRRSALVPDDLGELLGLQRGAADERAV